MSWHYLQEQEEVSSEDISWDGKQFVQSKSKTTLGEYCLPDNETESFQDSQSGMTLRRSMETPGEGKLMWYRGDSLVRTYLPQEKEQEYVVSDLECGPRWPESLARYDPVTYSWRTAQCSLVEGLESYSEIFSQWGMMHDGEFWEQDTLAPLTSEIESGLWPTPTCQEVEHPNAKITKAGRRLSKNGKTSHSLNLADRVALSINSPKVIFPTPSANEDAAGTPNGNMQKMLGNCEEVRGKTKEEWRAGTLNPDWVEWLMGWPIGWTDLKPLAMDKFQQWQHLHGNY